MHADKQHPNFLVFSGKPLLHMDEMNRLKQGDEPLCVLRQSDLIMNGVKK